MKDHRELYGINESLKSVEHKVHTYESEWHDAWKERVKGFCELEKRFYENGVSSKSGYKIADAYYEEAKTVIEFQKSFDDEALTKCKFYEKENIHLIWMFYLPTLSVFEDNGMYKIREDNFYHFFRIEQIMPNFYSENVVFVQDKNDKIYRIKALGRVETKSDLEGTVRYFDKELVFDNSNAFVHWLRFEWCKSDLFIDLKSIEEILDKFNDCPDKMFYLQNCMKNDVNGRSLIYCFIKDDGIIRKEPNGMGFLGYRCFAIIDGKYSVNGSWNSTLHSPKAKKWHLLATNLHKYGDLKKINN